jgi:hypothetical protein
MHLLCFTVPRWHRRTLLPSLQALAAVVVIGCAGRGSNQESPIGPRKLRGEWVAQGKNGGSCNLELKLDGTFLSRGIWEHGRGAGDYKIEGNKITLANNMGDQPITGKIDGETLLFMENLRFKRK